MVMGKIKKFIFNAFQVNTYLLYDETLDCAIIDAACYEEKEKKELVDFIKKNKLNLVRNINTHCHIDHILGNDFIAETFGIFPEYHEESVPFFLSAKEIGSSFGYSIEKFPDPERFIQGGDRITFGTTTLKVLYTPGHAAGSVCLYNESEGYVITGDVLFKDTIGRTDLPTGNFNALMSSIRERLFSLPEETIVYAGHGPDSTIGYEKQNNPFIR
jgi:hydroxyacylglutathione hydrolase